MCGCKPGIQFCNVFVDYVIFLSISSVIINVLEHFILLHLLTQGS